MEFGRTKDVDIDAEEIGAVDTPDSDAEAVASDGTPLWEQWDAAFDRAGGPFDAEEVDLEADDVKRLDLGTLVITPFNKMNLQLQVDKAKEKVQALLISDGSSAMEVAVFAGPTRSSMLSEIRDEVMKATTAAEGRSEVVEGPFGAEIRRRLPVTTPEGKPATHMSRTWLCAGPGWVLRGVVMGKAALEPDNQEADNTMWEFFTNLVVHRGSEPAVPGSVLHMDIPRIEVPQPDETQPDETQPDETQPDVQ